MTERWDERRAREIVESALGLPVIRHDDGTASAQVDALIKSPGGDVPLEIISDHDVPFNRQHDAIRKYAQGLHGPGLRSRWVVKMREGANVKNLVRDLPARLLAAQDEPGASNGWRRPRLPDMLADLPLEMAYPIEGEPVGQIHLRTPGWSGTTTSGMIAAWVEEVLLRQPDVARKLLTHPSNERHAFIWATMGSDFGAQFDLEDRGQPLPTSAPKLPDGLTHVWIAGTMSSQGCLAWFPDRGWWRVPMPEMNIAGR